MCVLSYERPVLEDSQFSMGKVLGACSTRDVNTNLDGLWELSKASVLYGPPLPKESNQGDNIYSVPIQESFESSLNLN